MSTKVYRFSVCFGWPYSSPPSSHKARIDYDPPDPWFVGWLESQLELAHSYRCRAVNIENYRRERYREVLTQHCPRLHKIVEQLVANSREIDAAYKKLKKRNQQANAARLRRGLKAPVNVIEPEDCVELVQLKEDRKSHYETYRTDLKAFLDESEKPASLVKLEEEWADVVKKYRLSKRTIGSPTSMVRQPRPIKEAWERVELARHSWREEYPVRKDLWLLDREIHAISIRLYNSSGLAWDTSGQINNDAKKTKAGKPPRVPKYDGQETLTIQMKSKGLPVRALLAGPNSVAWAQTLQTLRPAVGDRPASYLMSLILPTNAPTGGVTAKGLQKRPRRNKPLLRVPFVMHRPLPADGSIKNIRLVRKYVGARLEWEVQVVVNSSEEKEAAQGGVAQAVLGHTITEGEMLVATVTGDDGRVFKAVMTDYPSPDPSSSAITLDTLGNTTTYVAWGVLGLWQTASDLQRVADNEFEEAISILKSELGARTYPWLNEALQGLDEQWWRQSQLHLVANLWDQHGDTTSDLGITLRKWRERDWQHYTAMRGCAAKAERIRLDLYRKLATGVALNYHTVLLPDTNYAQKMKAPDNILEKDKWAVYRRLARTAALGLLRSCFEDRVAKCKKMKVERSERRSGKTSEAGQKGRKPNTGKALGQKLAMPASRNA